MNDPQGAWEEGFRAALDLARRMVVAAPVLVYGQRHSGMKGGVPRIMDTASNPDGDPDIVHCTYTLRDAVLGWIDRAETEASDLRSKAMSRSRPLGAVPSASGE